MVAKWYSEQSWAASYEAEQAARQAAAPAPRWLDEPGQPPPLRSTGRAGPISLSTPARSLPTPTTVADLRDLPAPATVVADTTPATVEGQPATEADPTPGEASIAGDEAGHEAEAGDEAAVETTTAASADEASWAPTERQAPASAVHLIDSEFRFLDPPEPGAEARIALLVRNDSTLPTGPLRLALATRWLSGWRVVAAEPPVLASYPLDGTRRAFDYPGLEGQTEATFELHLVATDDAVDPPELRLALAAGDEVARARPETVAPRPRPGPARALTIPRLELRSAVVPTAWEPPGFVVGQLRETANLSEGNTVLIGHLDGLAGNIFAHLDQLEPGDEVIAISRGLEYRFVVSETMVLPGDDSVPIQPTDEPRLTLMTCAGDWDPLGLDYSHRLWVVAEPADLAEQTLSGRSPGPLTRQLGLAPLLTIQAPADLGPSPKEVAATPPGDDADAAETAGAAPPRTPGAQILEPADYALVGQQVVVQGRQSAPDPSPAGGPAAPPAASASTADAPLWLVVRAEIEGSRWYVHRQPLAVGRDGGWSATLELGGAPGIRHTILVAPVDPGTDARLRRHVAERPGEPLSVLPDAFEDGARITVTRR